MGVKQKIKTDVVSCEERAGIFKVNHDFLEIVYLACVWAEVAQV